MIWEYIKNQTHLITAVTVQMRNPSFNTTIKGNRYLDYSSQFSKVLCYSQKARTFITPPLYPRLDDNACISALTERERKEQRSRDVKICPRLTSRERQNGERYTATGVRIPTTWGHSGIN